MKTEKYISLSAKLSLALLATALTAAQLTVNEVRDGLVMSSARKTAAEWFFFNANFNRFEAAVALMKPGASMVPPAKVSEEYEDLGSVNVEQDTKNVVVNVEVTDDFKGERQHGDSVFTDVLYPRPWHRMIGSEPFSKLSSFYKAAVEMGDFADSYNKFVQTKEAQKAFREGQLHPSYQNDPRYQMISYEEYVRELHLAAIARQIGLPIPPHDDKAHALDPSGDKWGAELYQTIERWYYARSVTVPLIDLKLSPSFSMIALALVDVVLSITLLSSLRLITLSGRGMSDEPWLVLDASGLLPRFVAALLRMVLLLCAPLSCLLAMLFIVGDRQFISGYYEPLRDRLMLGALAMLTAISVYCAVRIQLCLLHLRRGKPTRAKLAFQSPKIVFRGGAKIFRRRLSAKSVQPPLPTRDEDDT